MCSKEKDHQTPFNHGNFPRCCARHNWSVKFVIRCTKFRLFTIFFDFDHCPGDVVIESRVDQLVPCINLAWNRRQYGERPVEYSGMIPTFQIFVCSYQTLDLRLAERKWGIIPSENSLYGRDLSDCGDYIYGKGNPNAYRLLRMSSRLRNPFPNLSTKASYPGKPPNPTNTSFPLSPLLRLVVSKIHQLVPKLRYSGRNFPASPSKIGSMYNPLLGEIQCHIGSESRFRTITVPSGSRIACIGAH